MKYEDLILELSGFEVEEASRTKRVIMDFGPLFKEERTVVDEYEIDLVSFYLNLMSAANIKAGYDTKRTLAKSILSEVIEEILMDNDMDNDIEIDFQNNLVMYHDGGKEHKIRIGKVLGRSMPKPFCVVITHNILDIAGMSTDKNWTSCMNLRDGGERQTVFEEIKYGGMVAYLVQGTKDEINTILDDHDEGGLAQQRCFSRIAIKRMLIKENPKKFVFVAEDICYSVLGVGESITHPFRHVVEKVLSDSNSKTGTASKAIPGVVPASENSYSDSAHDSKYYFDKSKINSYSEKDKVLLVNDNPNLISLIKDPSEKLQLIAVRSDSRLIQYIENPTEDVKETAVRQNGFSIEHIKNPSDKIMKLAIDEDDDSVIFIDHPNKEIQIYALKAAYKNESISHLTSTYRSMVAETKTIEVHPLTTLYYKLTMALKWN